MAEDEVKVVNYSKGAAIVVQNAVNPGLFYIVKNGRVAVDSEHIQIDHELTSYSQGDSFGLVSALTEHHFLVTLFAETDVELLQIPIRLLGSFLKENKELAMKILRLYSHELRALQRNLSRANQPADREYFPEKLIQNAKTYIAWQKPDLAAHSLHRYIEWAKTHQGSNQIPEAENLLTQIRSNVKPIEWKNQKNTLNAGDVIFVESEMNRDIFVVLEGNVKLFSIVRGFEYVIDVLGAGEIFGEMSLIDNAPRMASAVAETPSTILRVTPENIFETVGESLMQKIFESIARRIWFSHQRLIILRMQSPVKRLYAFLYNSIRDQDIRKGANLTASYATTYQFPLAFEELCSMCGIIKVKNETIEEFLTDSNIVISKDRITVKSRKRIEERLGQYKTKQGQILAKLG
ncbi:Crp/Fnr family transcriptional regulator [Leptospira sp. 'Mane']|uniref:Crp/Fnr family transcriptional regulator n=1 Tax=Leptospira sp. 'Mane' TaxID=3387407 RepID=UPI00398B9F0D